MNDYRNKIKFVLNKHWVIYGSFAATMKRDLELLKVLIFTPSSCLKDKSIIVRNDHYRSRHCSKLGWRSKPSKPNVSSAFPN